MPRHKTPPTHMPEHRMDVEPRRLDAEDPVTQFPFDDSIETLYEGDIPFENLSQSPSAFGYDPINTEWEGDRQCQPLTLVEFRNLVINELSSNKKDTYYVDMLDDILQERLSRVHPDRDDDDDELFVKTNMALREMSYNSIINRTDEHAPEWYYTWLRVESMIKQPLDCCSKLMHVMQFRYKCDVMAMMLPRVPKPRDELHKRFMYRCMQYMRVTDEFMMCFWDSIDAVPTEWREMCYMYVRHIIVTAGPTFDAMTPKAAERFARDPCACDGCKSGY